MLLVLWRCILKWNCISPTNKIIKVWSIQLKVSHQLGVSSYGKIYTIYCTSNSVIILEMVYTILWIVLCHTSNGIHNNFNDILRMMYTTMWIVYTTPIVYSILYTRMYNFINNPLNLRHNHATVENSTTVSVYKFLPATQLFIY